jgi:hypothetical protein
MNIQPNLRMDNVALLTWMRESEGRPQVVGGVEAILRIPASDLHCPRGYLCRRMEKSTAAKAAQDASACKRTHREIPAILELFRNYFSSAHVA